MKTYSEIMQDILEIKQQLSDVYQRLMELGSDPSKVDIAQIQNQARNLRNHLLRQHAASKEHAFDDQQICSSGWRLREEGWERSAVRSTLLVSWRQT